MNNENNIDKKSDFPPATFGEGQSKHTDIRSGRIEVIATADDNINITEPSTPTHPQYPWNQASQSLSGHLKEIDDTPGAERLLKMHKAGTFEEIHPDGSKVTKIFGKDFYIVLDDHMLFVGGNLNITVQGNTNLLVSGNLTTKVGGDLNTIVHGDMTTRVTGKTVHYSRDTIDFQSAENIRIKSEKSIQLQSKLEMNFNSEDAIVIRAETMNKFWSKGRTYIDGSRIDYNLPGEEPPEGNIVNNDPGAGLNISDSLIQPSIESQFSLRCDNPEMISTIPGNITFPKDREIIE